MGAKTDVVVKLVLVFFISLLSFSIGTFVGKKYSDNQHKLAALEPGKAAHSSQDVASTGHGAPESHATAANEHGAVSKSNDGMTDEEIAKLAEEFVADETTAVNAHATAPETEEPPTSAPKTRTLDKAEPLGPAKNIAREKVAAAPETRVPSSIPKDIGQYSAGKFTVQVGAYSKEEEAQKIAGELKAKGFSAFYIPAKVKGQTWYRVSVGLFATPREAQDYRTELMSKAKLSSALVQKIVQ